MIKTKQDNWRKEWDAKWTRPISGGSLYDGKRDFTSEAQKEFIGDLLVKIKERAKESEVKFVKRLKLEVDVNVCECGEEWKDTDIADLIKNRLKEIFQ